MVDTLIVVDALSLVAHTETVVVSDDQDMVPALVAGHLKTGRMLSLRTSPRDRHFFDEILLMHGVPLLTLPEDFRRG